MDQWFGPVHDATVGVLTRAGYEVVAPASQTCCGALAAHDGHTADARRLAQANLEALSGADLVVSDSAGCTAHLKEYGHWAPGGEAFAAGVRDVTELVAELIDQGALPEFPPSGMDVAIQDPCHLRHVQRIVDQPRRLVRAAGYTPVEIDPDGLCCGAAGIYSILQPEASHQLGARKADQVVATGAALVASANPGCEMQLRSHLGGAYRVVHPIELYWESLARGGAPSNDGRDAIVSPR
jgi:glycolate oxidase iron-sulfur subunit